MLTQGLLLNPSSCHCPRDLVFPDYICQSLGLSTLITLLFLPSSLFSKESNTRHLAPLRDFWIAFGGPQTKPQLSEMVLLHTVIAKPLSLSCCCPRLNPEKGENTSDTHRAAFPITAVATEVIKIIAVPDLPQQRLLGAGNAACFTLVGRISGGDLHPGWQSAAFPHLIICTPSPRRASASFPTCLFYVPFGFAINKMHSRVKIPQGPVKRVCCKHNIYICCHGDG